MREISLDQQCLRWVQEGGFEALEQKTHDHHVRKGAEMKIRSGLGKADASSGTHDTYFLVRIANDSLKILRKNRPK